MHSDQLTIVLTFSISLAFLWLCYFWLYKGYMIDLFRQKMFILRDELFDDAASGLIDFDHPAYGTLRRTMNGFIRFAHKLDLMEAILLLVMVDEEQLAREDDHSFSERLKRDMANLPPETVTQLNNYRRRMQKQIVAHCLRISPFLTFILTLPIIIFILFRGIQKMKNDTIQKIRSIESTAFSYGRS